MNKVEKFKTRVSKYGFKYVFKIIMRNKVYRPLDLTTFFIAKKIWGKSALKDIIIMESHNDFDSNDGAFYNYLIANGYNERYKIVWLLRNPKPKMLPQNVYAFDMFKPSLRKSYYNCIAKYITYDHVPTKRVQNEQKIVYLTHGPFGLKGFKGKIIIPEDVDGMLCPSEYLAPILAEQYRIDYPNEKQLFLGYPMHDLLYSKKEGDLKKVTTEVFNKVILWMPTFRKPIDFNRNDSAVESPLGIPIFESDDDLVKLNELLQKMNSLLIIKIHPMQDITTIRVEGKSNIIVLDAKTVKLLEVDNYRLMKDTDALISDYSSVAYDYLHLDKPIAYTMDDVDCYTLGLIVNNPKEFMAGHIIYDKAQFMAFIKDVVNGKDIYKDERKTLFNKIFKYHDGNSCKRLADYMGLHLK